MEIAFTLKKMDEIYQEAYGYYTEYKESLSEINTIINNIGNYWKSTETYTYEEFIELYKDKYKKLLMLQEYMRQYCDVLLSRKNNFSTASNNAIKNFE